jgi:hypothetical protein
VNNRGTGNTAIVFNALFPNITGFNRPSHWNFLFSWMLAFLCVGAGALCVWIYFNGGTSPLLFVPCGIGVLILLYIYIRRVRQRFIVTDRKVEIQTGVARLSQGKRERRGPLARAELNANHTNCRKVPPPMMTTVP